MLSNLASSLLAQSPFAKFPLPYIPLWLDYYSGAVVPFHGNLPVDMIDLCKDSFFRGLGNSWERRAGQKLLALPVPHK